jgi:hypothetical protein
MRTLGNDFKHRPLIDPLKRPTVSGTVIATVHALIAGAGAGDLNCEPIRLVIDDTKKSI